MKALFYITVLLGLLVGAVTMPLVQDAIINFCNRRIAWIRERRNRLEKWLKEYDDENEKK